MFTLAVVGRPNVGKSTLFNRIAGKQLALVHDQPGVTRDWREAEGYIYNQKIRIIDTAGLEENFDDSIKGRMRQKTEEALTRADAILFLVDGRADITPLDQHFASWLRKKNLPVILGVNKCENEDVTQTAMAEAYGLGLGAPIALSAAHGHGFNELYDLIKPYIKEDHEFETSEEEDGNLSDEELDSLEGNEAYDFISVEDDEQDQDKPLKLAIVGRPNVGKSTLLNALLQENRVMTGPEAGITRDAISVEWVYKEQNFKLIDTAGLRKKAKVQDSIEKMSVTDSFRAIRLAQIVVLVVDANELLEKQDLQIADHVIKEGRALVLAVNKWDVAKDKKELIKDIDYRLNKSLAQLKDIPVVTISALKKKNLSTLMDKAISTYKVWNTRVSTGQLNRWLGAMESQHPAPLVQGRQNRLRYITQIKTRPPTFALWVSRPKELPKDYRRYIINGLRKDFSIPGVPIRMLVRTSKNPYK
jgi:GTP-binding protein